MASKWMSVMMAGALATSALTGCASKEQPAAPVKDVAKPDASKEKFTITAMTQSFAGGGWPDKHPVIDKLNEKLNIDLQMQWVPSDNYKEKLNVISASNEFPDVYLVMQEQYNKWKDKGIFLDVKPFLKDYPNLSKSMEEEQLKLLNPADKYFGLPYYNTTTRDSFGVRKDWLDKLALKEPKTVDEFYEVAKAFATKDPDGNGKPDTMGFTFYISPNHQIVGIESIMHAFGIVNRYKAVNGKLLSQYEQAKEWKDFASFLRKAYAEGVLDKDFAVNKLGDLGNKFESSKVGFGTINPNQFYGTMLPNTKKSAPDANIVALEPVKGPGGQGSNTSISATQKIVINAKIDKNKQQRILKMLDYIVSEEGNVLTKNGVEGIHYKKEGSNYVKLEAFDKDRPFLLSTWFFRSNDPLIQVRLWDDKKIADGVKSFFTLNAKYPVPNAGMGLESETDIKVGPTLNQKFMDGIIKVVVGREPVESIDKLVADWKANGGDKIMAELNAQFGK